MQELILLESKSLRDEYSSRVEILKDFGMEVNSSYVSIKNISLFYEVSVDAIESIVRRNREELESDGMKKFTYTELISGDPFCQVDGATINSQGCLGFTQKCIIRIGMLLTESLKAKQIRDAIIKLIENVSCVSNEVKDMETHPLMIMTKRFVK